MDKFFPYMFGAVPPPMNTYTYYDSLIVVDFEATCDDAKTTGGDAAIRPLRSERQEIIQFPAVLIDVRQMTIVDHFDAYVKPVEKPVLSDFCTSLTGITQVYWQSSYVFFFTRWEFSKFIQIVVSSA